MVPGPLTRAPFFFWGVFRMAKAVLDFLRCDRGEAVPWLVVMLVGIMLAVIVWKGLGPGVRQAAQKMGNALAGQ